MRAWLWTVAVFLFLTVPAGPNPQVPDPGVAFRDDFESLGNWKPLTFPKIPRHTVYSVSANGDGSVLTARSDASASGLLLKVTFDPYTHPILSWRWKVENVYTGVDPTSRQGDDYPLRIYVVFEYDPGQAGLGLRAQYALARALYGQYPPLASLNYVWASRKTLEPVYDNPYTARARMIPLQAGPERLGQWVTEEVDILADFRRAFGKDPPSRASLGIMNDSDNTGQSGVSHLDFIEVRKNRAGTGGGP